MESEPSLNAEELRQPAINPLGNKVIKDRDIDAELDKEEREELRAAKTGRVMLGRFRPTRRLGNVREPSMDPLAPKMLSTDVDAELRVSQQKEDARVRRPRMRSGRPKIRIRPPIR